MSATWLMGAKGGGGGGGGGVVRPVLLSGWLAGVSDIHVWVVLSPPRTRQAALSSLVTDDTSNSNVNGKYEPLSFAESDLETIALSRSRSTIIRYEQMRRWSQGQERPGGLLSRAGRSPEVRPRCAMSGHSLFMLVQPITITVSLLLRKARRGQ